MNNYISMPPWYFVLACVVQFFLGQVARYSEMHWIPAAVLNGVTLGVFMIAADLFYKKGD
jgi:hypothetical protein